MWKVFFIAVVGDSGSSGIRRHESYQVEAFLAIGLETVLSKTFRNGFLTGSQLILRPGYRFSRKQAPIMFREVYLKSSPQSPLVEPMINWCFSCAECRPAMAATDHSSPCAPCPRSTRSTISWPRCFLDSPRPSTVSSKRVLSSGALRRLNHQSLNRQVRPSTESRSAS